MLGALAYYSKAFGFPLFLFLLLSEWWTVRKQPGTLRYFFRALGAFLLLVAPWVTAISLKYGHITISEAAAFNRSPGVAPMPGQIMQLPVLSNELTKPAGAHAISAWEEPMQLAWTGRVSEPTCVVPGFLQVLERNLLTIWYFDFQRNAGWGLLALMMLFLLFKNKMQFRLEDLSQRSRPLAWLVTLPLLATLGLVLALGLSQLRNVTGELTFVETLIVSTVIFQVWNLLDLVLLDWFLLMTLKPKFMILPGTEGMAGYSDYKFHFHKFLNGIVFTFILALLVPGIALGVEMVI